MPPPPVEHEIDPERLGERVRNLDGLAELRRAAGDLSLYLVGGVVRDLLLGVPHAELDLVVEGELRPIAESLGGEQVDHERFATAVVRVGDLRIDLASARRESYPRPGALPEVEPASLREDLGRRDFTVNAMAVPLRGEPELIDPHGGLADLRAGLLRVLHPGSFRDDPTRALRATRYAARFGLGLEPETERLLRETDLSTVSEDRVDAELRRIAFEREPELALRLVRDWDLLDLPANGPELAGRAIKLVRSEPWEGVASPGDLALAALGRGPKGSEPAAMARELARAEPGRASEGLRLASGRAPEELALARAMGGEWLDDYLGKWSRVALEIGGEDLIEAGIPEGPAVGAGLEAALAAKLDGEVRGRQQELEVALAAARERG